MMRVGILACMVLWLSAGLAGCGTYTVKPPQKPAAVVEVPRPRPQIIKISEVETLLRYFEQIKKLPEPELSKEYERVRQGFALDKSDFVRLQLVLFAILPNASSAEIAQGLILIDPLLKDNAGPSPLGAFALLLNAVLTEQKRLEDGMQGMRVVMQDLKNGMQGLTQKLKEQQRHEEELQEKLDALKAMEGTLMERERARPMKKK